MGVKVECNWGEIEINDKLTLRAYGARSRRPEECLPEVLELNNVYPFLKEGQRVYDPKNPIPLHETKGSQDLSDILAYILIIEPTPIIINGQVWTRGKYEVMKLK